MSDITQTPIQAEETKSGGSGIRWTTIAIWAAIIGLLALLGWGLVKTNATRPEAGQQAPYFDVEFFNGYKWEDKPVSDLDEMAGKVVVLNFWASWCVE